MDYSSILYEKKDGLARITLNRPDHLNALSRTLLSELVAALKEAEDDAGVKVVIIKGAGRAFCAGYDIEPRKPDEYSAGVAPILDDYKAMREITNKLTAIWKLQSPSLPRCMDTVLPVATTLRVNVILSSQPKMPSLCIRR